MTKNQIAFVQWFKQNDPFLYEVALKRGEIESQGVGGWGDIFKNITDTIKDVVPKLVETRNSKKILDAQLKRAQNNLPPLVIKDYTPSVPHTQVTDTATTTVAQNAVNQSSNNTMMLAAAGLGAMFLFMKKRR